MKIKIFTLDEIFKSIVQSGSSIPVLKQPKFGSSSTKATHRNLPKAKAEGLLPVKKDPHEAKKPGVFYRRKK